MSRRIRHTAVIDADYIHERIDVAAADLFPQYSRSTLQGWIRSGQLTVNGRKLKASQKMKGGEALEIDAEQPEVVLEAEPIPLDIVFEDEHLLVLNKPAGLVVHPGAGNWSGTLLNGLLHHDENQGLLPRGGIVHRLDKDTTGLMVVARDSVAFQALVSALAAREVRRIYEAFVHGKPPGTGSVDEPIGRHPTQRTRMVVVRGGKPAVTHFDRIEQFESCARLKVRLETGRTHQIRVHMQHLGFPLLGDPVYGRKPRPADPASVTHLERQALHATSLGLKHPVTGEVMQFDRPLPDDMLALLESLREADPA